MQSTNTYHLPLSNPDSITLIVKDNPGHTGRYKGAIDFAVPIGTPVLAPLDGRIKEVVDKHAKYGATKEFAPYCNYITIGHKNGELSDLIHLAKKSVVVKVGDKVKSGQKLAEVGLSGWLTESHLHWQVHGSKKPLEITGDTIVKKLIAQAN